MAETDQLNVLKLFSSLPYVCTSAHVSTIPFVIMTIKSDTSVDYEKHETFELLDQTNNCIP